MEQHPRSPIQPASNVGCLPGYEYGLKFDEKAEMAETDQGFPAMIAETAQEGYPTDIMIYKHIGHIIGLPLRGLPNDENEDENLPFAAILSTETDDSQENKPPRKRHALDPKTRRVLSLQNLAVGRWRVALFTPASLQHTLVLRSAQANSNADHKKRLAEEKLEAKQVKEAEKVTRVIATAQKKMDA